MIFLNLLVGTLVVAVGFWLLSGGASPVIVAMGVMGVGGFLWWRARTITEVWAWSTLFLGVESFAWPLTLMAQLKSASDRPSEDEMGTILSAVVMGLFSSVFWISFAYGLFRRAWRIAADPPHHPSPSPAVTQPAGERRSADLTPSPRGPHRRRT